MTSQNHLYRQRSVWQITCLPPKCNQIWIQWICLVLETRYSTCTSQRTMNKNIAHDILSVVKWNWLDTALSRVVSSRVVSSRVLLACGSTWAVLKITVINSIPESPCRWSMSKSTNFKALVTVPWLVEVLPVLCSTEVCSDPCLTFELVQ